MVADVYESLALVICQSIWFQHRGLKAHSSFHWHRGLYLSTDARSIVVERGLASTCHVQSETAACASKKRLRVDVVVLAIFDQGCF